jgi:hypothetical protein
VLPVPGVPPSPYAHEYVNGPLPVAEPVNVVEQGEEQKSTGDALNEGTGLALTLINAVFVSNALQP